MMNVAILDDYQNISKNFIEFSKFKDRFNFKIFNEPFDNEESTIAALKDFEILFLMRERTPISKSLIINLKKLKLIITSGMRNNAIDLDAAKKKNIVVCGTDINPNPAAEITWALILGLSRNLKEEIENMFQGYWQTTIGVELKNKVLGVVGLGKVGTQVAKIGKAFGMQVVAWSENLNLGYAREVGVLPITKEELLKTSDFITIHLVLGERYKNLITHKEFGMMKKNSFLINTSRGQIINEKDLIAALKSEKISGVGLDVFDHEPLPENHKLRFMPNALILPHLGFVTQENYSLFYSQMIENLISYTEGKTLRVIT